MFIKLENGLVFRFRHFGGDVEVESNAWKEGKRFFSIHTHKSERFEDACVRYIDERILIEFKSAVMVKINKSIDHGDSKLDFRIRRLNA